MEPETTADDRPRGENFYLHALLGAVVTVFTSVIPFSPLLGGALAGYLHGQGKSRGTKVGLISGLFASIPLALLFVVLLTVMSFGSIMTGEVAGPLFVVFIVGIVFLFVGLYTVGLSAAGGYVGAAFADSRDEPGRTTSDTSTRPEPGQPTDDGR